MISFIVFGGVAIISIVFLLRLSLRYSVSSVISWLGSLLQIAGSVMILTNPQGVQSLIANALFSFGVILYLAGMYTLAARYISKDYTEDNTIQSRTIGDILEVAASRESLIELLNYSLDRFLEIFSLNSGAIHIFHAKKNKLVMGSYRGLIPSYAKKMEILEPGQTAIGRAVQNQRVLIIRDLSVSPDYNFFGGKNEGYSFLAVAPIVVEDKCWGVITLLGRRKYHKGIFTIDQLEQFGRKLGKALVLGRENRRMSAAYNHLNNVLDYYNSVFSYLKEASFNKSEWSDSNILATLRLFKAQLFDSKSFAIIKYTESGGECLYIQNHAIPTSYEKNKQALPPQKFSTNGYFMVERNELGDLVSESLFKNKQIAAYGYQFDNDFQCLVVVGNCSLKELPDFGESILIIGNLLSLCYVRHKFDYQLSTGEKQSVDIDREKMGKLSSLLNEISGDIQVLNERMTQGDLANRNEFLEKRLHGIGDSALKGMKLLGQLNNMNNPNDLIQAAINESDTNIAFYPGVNIPHLKTSPDEFKTVIDQIISEAIVENKRIRLKSSPGENGSISLTIEGPVSDNFPSRSTLLNSRAENIVLHVQREAETDITEPFGDITNEKLPGLNLLTIEDKPVITDLLDVFLDKLGCTNIIIPTGVEALSYLESRQHDDHRFDAVIIDMTLEDISGLELCRKIKQLDNAIYIILISSWGVNLNQYTLDDAGVDAILQKPFSLEHLQKVLPKKDLTDAT